MPKELVSLRIPKEIKEKLEKLAKATGRTKTYIAIEAIEEYCTTQEWQIEAILKGIESANKENLISHEEIKQYWEQKRANTLE